MPSQSKQFIYPLKQVTQIINQQTPTISTQLYFNSQQPMYQSKPTQQSGFSSQSPIQSKTPTPLTLAYDPSHQANLQKTLEHFQSCMILGCVGDTIGYKNAKWEFQKDGSAIEKEIHQRTNGKGIMALQIIYYTETEVKELKKLQEWRYSDDTVMQMATADGLLNSNVYTDPQLVIRSIAAEYKKCVKDMSGRAPGKTTLENLAKMKQDGSNWYTSPYNPMGAGCGGSMRTACIGLAYFRQKDIDKLIEVSIQTTRITHHHPKAWLGALLAAYFTSLAIRRVNPKLWMYYFLYGLQEKVVKYVTESKRSVKENLGQQWKRCIECVSKYCSKRNIDFSEIPPKLSEIKVTFSKDFPRPQYRYKEWLQLGFGSTWPGSLGMDSVLIAYDSLLYCEASYQKMLTISVVHGGDSDSTAAIACAWYGAYYGMGQVPHNHYIQMEGFTRVNRLGRELFERFCVG